MLKIDSGNRVIRIDPAKINKIVASWRASHLVDIYEIGNDTPTESLTDWEALAFIKRTYDPDRCRYRGEAACYWTLTDTAPAGCIRCRIAQILFEKTGKDIRPKQEAIPFPIVPFCLLSGTALLALSLVGALSAVRLSDQRQSLTTRVEELSAKKEGSR